MRSRIAWVCVACLALTVCRTGTAGEADPIAIYDAVSPSVGMVVAFDDARYPLASGAGFFVGSSDVFVTQLALVQHAGSASVKTADGTFVDVLGVVGVDEDAGLVALRTEDSGVTAATLSNVRARVGATVILGGSVDGLATAFATGSITGTLFSSAGSRFYALDAPVGAWNAGAPVLDVDGGVVGVAADTPDGPVAVTAQSIAALIEDDGEDMSLAAATLDEDASAPFGALIDPTRDLPSLDEGRGRSAGEKAALLVALALFVAGGYEVAFSIAP